MFTLIIGGSASGKSEYAEQQMLTLPGQRVYIATLDVQVIGKKIVLYKESKDNKKIILP